MYVSDYAAVMEMAARKRGNARTFMLVTVHASAYSYVVFLESTGFVKFGPLCIVLPLTRHIVDTLAHISPQQCVLRGVSLFLAEVTHLEPQRSRFVPTVTTQLRINLTVG